MDLSSLFCSPARHHHQPPGTLKRRTRTMITPSASLKAIILLVSLSCMNVASFVRNPVFVRKIGPATTWIDRRTLGSLVATAAARYGPPEDTPPIESVDDLEQEEWEKRDAVRVERQEKEFQTLIEQVMTAKSPEVLPGIMTKHMELILSIRGYEGSSLIENAIKEATKAGGEEFAQQVMGAIDFVLNFVEEFVDQASTVDQKNKLLLGKIIRGMSERTSGSTDRDQEIFLDDLLEREKENFSPGFLRHVEGECERIATAPKMTKESSRLLQIMRVIQARVVEELGKDLGEGALVLGQLLGYDDKNERLAVLDAGLTVRGVGFGKELKAMTEEALEGFTNIPNVERELIERVEGIDERIQKFIDKNDQLQ